MATLQLLFQFSPKLIRFKTPLSFSVSKKLIRVSSASRFSSSCCQSSSTSNSVSAAETENSVSMERVKERPPFDINFVVVLAGFAFEAYTTPPEEIGKCEIDAAKCHSFPLRSVCQYIHAHVRQNAPAADSDIEREIERIRRKWDSDILARY